MENVGPEAPFFHRAGLEILDLFDELNDEGQTILIVTHEPDVAQLDDGRTVTGMITDESAASVTLTRAENATDTLPRAEIELLRSTGQSIMPEGLERQLDQQAMADLLAYLHSLP